MQFDWNWKCYLLSLLFFFLFRPHYKRCNCRVLTESEWLFISIHIYFHFFTRNIITAFWLNLKMLFIFLYSPFRNYKKYNFWLNLSSYLSTFTSFLSYFPHDETPPLTPPTRSEYSPELSVPWTSGHAWYLKSSRLSLVQESMVEAGELHCPCPLWYPKVSGPLNWQGTGRASRRNIE